MKKTMTETYMFPSLLSVLLIIGMLIFILLYKYWKQSRFINASKFKFIFVTEREREREGEGREKNLNLK